MGAQGTPRGVDGLALSGKSAEKQRKSKPSPRPELGSQSEPPKAQSR